MKKGSPYFRKQVCAIHIERFDNKFDHLNKKRKHKSLVIKLEDYRRCFTRFYVRIEAKN